MNWRTSRSRGLRQGGGQAPPSRTAWFTATGTAFRSGSPSAGTVRHGRQDEARDRAREVLTEAARGADPAADKSASRRAATIAELCDLYLADAEAEASKKSRTLRLNIAAASPRQIGPLLGRMKVGAVTVADVEAFMRAVVHGKSAGRAVSGKLRGRSHWRGGRGAASRAVGLLGAVFAYAVRHGMRPDNPAHGVQRPADGRRDRRLTDSEYAKLGAALRTKPSSRSGHR